MELYLFVSTLLFGIGFYQIFLFLRDHTTFVRNKKERKKTKRVPYDLVILGLGLYVIITVFILKIGIYALFLILYTSILFKVKSEFLFLKKERESKRGRLSYYVFHVLLVSILLFFLVLHIRGEYNNYMFHEQLKGRAQDTGRIAMIANLNAGLSVHFDENKYYPIVSSGECVISAKKAGTPQTLFWNPIYLFFKGKGVGMEDPFKKQNRYLCPQTPGSFFYISDKQGKKYLLCANLNTSGRRKANLNLEQLGWREGQDNKPIDFEKIRTIIETNNKKTDKERIEYFKDVEQEKLGYCVMDEMGKK